MEEIEVTILNWDKFNDRKDIKHHTWFRLENKINQSQSLFALTSSEKWAWLCLLCFASQKGSATVSLLKPWFCKVNDVSQEDLEGMLAKLTDNGSIRTETNVPERARSSTVTTDITDITDRQTLTSASADAYASIFETWNEYSPPLKAVRAFSPKRKKAAKARWNEHPDPEYWRFVIEKVTKSRFLNGGGSQGWVATIDWLLKPDSHVKVTEGQYDEKDSGYQGMTEEQHAQLWEK